MSNKTEETVAELRGRNAFKKYGPLCTSEGFYQHSGECWSDAFQMIMLYTDGMKEFTQVKLANEDVEFKDIETRFEPFVLETIHRYGLEWDKENFKTKNLRAIFLYFKAVQERFRRHYMAEIERYGKFGPMQCYSFEKVGKDSLEILNQIAKMYRSTNTGVEKQGIRSAIMGKGSKEFYKANREEIGKSRQYNSSVLGFAPGGSIEDIQYLIKLYALYFSIDLSMQTQEIFKNPIIEINNDINAYYISIKKGRGPRHAICFLQCGGKQYYYDDNEGIFLFPWKKLFKEYNELLSKSNAGNSPTIIFGSLAQIKDATTGTILFETLTFPFLRIMKSDGEVRYTFLSEKEGPIKIQLPRENPTFYEESFKSEDKLYTFSFIDKNKEFELHSLSSILNVSKEYTKSTYNVNTGTLLGSRYKKSLSNLQKAIYLEDRNTIRKLMNTEGFNINEQDSQGNTILHMAVKLNDTNLMQKVLEIKDVNMNVQNYKGETPLTLAILNKQYDIVKYLLANGADVRIKNKEFFPIEILIGENNLTNSPESFELIEQIAKLGNIGEIADKNLFYTIRQQNYKLLDLFVKYGLNLNKIVSKEKFGSEYYPLEFAAMTGDFELFIFLLEHGAKPDFAPYPQAPTRTIKNRLLYYIEKMPEQMKEKFLTEMKKYETQQGGTFSRKRKNLRTKKTKKRKTRKL